MESVKLLEIFQRLDLPHESFLVDQDGVNLHGNQW